VRGENTELNVKYKKLNLHRRCVQLSRYNLHNCTELLITVMLQVEPYATPINFISSKIQISNTYSRRGHLPQPPGWFCGGNHHFLLPTCREYELLTEAHAGRAGAGGHAGGDGNRQYVHRELEQSSATESWAWASGKNSYSLHVGKSKMVISSTKLISIRRNNKLHCILLLCSYRITVIWPLWLFWQHHFQDYCVASWPLPCCKKI
jgi:hypothetical protein